jgi:hypothetical protein
MKASDKSSGQIQLHKSLQARGRRLKAKSLVTALKVATEPDLPSNQCACESWLAGSIPVRSATRAFGSLGSEIPRPIYRCTG